MKSLRPLTLAIVCGLAGLAGGLWLGGHPEKLPDGLRDTFVEEDRALRAEVIDAIKDSYYKPVDEKRLRDDSLKGLVRSLDDRFSHYFTPKEAKLFEQSVSGRFEGVGLSVEQNRRGLEVINVFDGTPAKRAGIKKGDIVTKVNGRSIAGEPTDVATARIKGKAGTSVSLTVYDPTTKRDRTTRLERARIEVPIVQGRITTVDGAKLAVIRLSSFTDGAHGQLRTEIDRLVDRGARGVLLDLRGNSGGLLEEARLVASQFIGEGVIVSTRGRARAERKLEAVGTPISERIPVVVLVDRGSASASEIVAGALRDTGRGKVVGTRTFGKGVFQELEPLSNDGLLDLTVGSYYLPKGDNISDRGITPQIRARDLPRTRRDEALPKALEVLRSELG